MTVGPGVQYVLDTAKLTMYVYGETIPDSLWERCGWDENAVCSWLCREAISVACGFVDPPQWCLIMYPHYELAEVNRG